MPGGDVSFGRGASQAVHSLIHSLNSLTHSLTVEGLLKESSQPVVDESPVFWVANRSKHAALRQSRERRAHMDSLPVRLVVSRWSPFSRSFG